MDYQTFEPHPDLSSVVKCYWTLEVPASFEAPKQLVIPDGSIEMYFILGEDVKRYTSDTDFIIQPRAMVFGQVTKSYYVQPVGEVNTFAVRFYPFGFANFVSSPINELADTETPLKSLFGEAAQKLTKEISDAKSTEERIKLVEAFLLDRLLAPTTIDHIVTSTIDALASTKGSASIHAILKDDPSKRRSLERKFAKQVGISPKQLGRIIRLQAALKMILNEEAESLTQVAYESDYYDQSHFIKDFKEFTGTNPKEYLSDKEMTLSSIIYSSK